MKRKLLFPVVALFCLLSGHVLADGHMAATTPPMVDTYACSYINGSDADDLDKAVSFWNQQMDKIDNEALNQFSAWILTPVRSTLPADFYFLGASPNMTAWANGMEAYAASDEGQAADDRFNKISKCTGATWMSEQVYGEPGPNEDGNTNTILEAAGCTLREGKTMSNVRALEANFVAEAKAAGLEMNIFRFSPVYTNGEVDVVYFVGHPDTATFVANGNKGWNTKGLRMANALTDIVMDCGAGLYNAENIRMGQGAGEN